ncbi:MAG TPA: Lpg1974 family pore-forming outer membrane protein [Gemmataceae bacterium]|nr:Lpg1974 family pore-forming outer membrane protein [Gemmataceae bacterium]
MGRSLGCSVLYSYAGTILFAAVALGQPPIDVPPPSGPPAPIGVPYGPPAPVAMQPAMVSPAGPPMEVITPSGGWFVDLEGGALLPHLSHVKTSSDGNITFLSDIRSLDFDCGPAGEVDLGYRFAGGNGWRLSYRGFDSSGHADSTGDATLFEPMFFAGFNAGLDAGFPIGINVGRATRELRSEVQLSRIDLDYLSADHVFGDTVHLGWVLGARIVALRVDSRVNDTFTLSDDLLGPPVTVTLRQGARDETVAGGIHASLDGSWTPADWPIGMFGLLDAGILGGGSTQKYSVAIINDTLTNAMSGSEHGGSVVGTLNLQAGLQYTVPFANGGWWGLRGGYEFELYDFEATGGGAGKHALYKGFDLTTHGVFLRGELGF